MSQRADQLGREFARAAGLAALGGTVRVSPFAGVSQVEAVITAIDLAGGLASAPKSAIGDADGNLLFMTGFSKTGGTDVTG